MSSDDHQDDARTVGDRIAEVIRANEHAPKKTLTDARTAETQSRGRTPGPVVVRVQPTPRPKN